MRSSNRPARKIQCIPEPGFDHVGEIDQHTELVHLADNFLAGGAEAARRVDALVVETAIAKDLMRALHFSGSERRSDI